MNEKFPSSESEFSPDERDLIEFLKTHKGEESEVMSRIGNWITAEGDRLRVAGADQRETITCNLKRAKLFRAGGLSADAWSILNNIRYEANQSGDFDLQQAAESLMDEIDASGELSLSDQSEKIIDESLERQRGFGPSGDA